MCIRDSPNQVHPRRTRPARQRAGAVGDDLGPAGEGGGVGPVSYTHLRAHETVLDLVCRLLLEKKKDIARVMQ